MLGRSSISNPTSNPTPPSTPQTIGQVAPAQATGIGQIFNASAAIGASLQNGRAECSQSLVSELPAAVGTSCAQAPTTHAVPHGTTLSDLKAAIDSGNVAAVRAIINATPDFGLLDPAGDSALLLAAELKQVEIVKILLDAGARISDVNQALAARSLRVAASEDSSAGVEAWVAAGADINGKNQNQATALMLAAQRGHVNAAQALVKFKADVDAMNKQGETALTLAAVSGHVDMVKLLRTVGAAIKPSQADKSSARLDESIQSGAWQKAVAWYSVGLPKLSSYASLSSFNPFARSGRGSMGEIEVLGFLAASSRTPESANLSVSEKDQLDLNMYLAFSACAGRIELAEALRQAGALIPRGCCASAGRALRDAVREGRFDVARAWLAAGADVNATNEHGWTALLYSIQFLDQSFIRCLIAAGANLDVADKDGETALMLAVRNGNSVAVQILLESGASTELKDNQQRTVMNRAVQAENFPAVELLLRSGAQISRSDLHAVALSLTRDLSVAERSGHALYRNASLSIAARSMPVLRIKLIEMMLPFQQATVMHV